MLRASSRSILSQASQHCRFASAAFSAMAPSPFYGFEVKTIKGEPYPLSQLEGKVVAVVNTASKCGFTSQYSGLEALYAKYKDQGAGLVILGFPCNQFGGQEPGSAEEVATFCSAKGPYPVSFPIMEKCEVNGEGTHPLYAWLKSQKKQLGMERIKWNFEKFLVDREGNVVKRYSSVSTPESMDKDVAALL